MQKSKIRLMASGNLSSNSMSFINTCTVLALLRKRASGSGKGVILPEEQEVAPFWDRSKKMPCLAPERWESHSKASADLSHLRTPKNGQLKWTSLLHGNLHHAKLYFCGLCKTSIEPRSIIAYTMSNAGPIECIPPSPTWPLKT